MNCTRNCGIFWYFSTKAQKKNWKIEMHKLNSFKRITFVAQVVGIMNCHTNQHNWCSFRMNDLTCWFKANANVIFKLIHNCHISMFECRILYVIERVRIWQPHTNKICSIVHRSQFEVDSEKWKERVVDHLKRYKN